MLSTKRFNSLKVLGVVVMFLTTASFSHAAVYINGNVSTDYVTIQAAVTAAVAGDVIDATAGTYTENVTINKALTLQGEQVGVDARGRGASETIVTAASGTVFNVSATGVTIDGFQFNGTGANYLVFVDEGDLVVQNNIFDGTAGNGMWFGSAAPNATVYQNEITGTSFSGNLMFFDGSVGDNFDDLTIEDNAFYEGEIFAGDKIFTSSNMQMLGNEFDGAYMNLSAAFENSLIDNNTFTNNLVGNVDAQFGLRNSTVSNNFFGDTGSPANRAAMELFGGEWGLTPSQDVIITHNTFESNGLRLRTGLDATTITVTENNFTHRDDEPGAAGLTNEAIGTVSATCNWWDDIGGPDAGAGIIGDATYAPWLDGPWQSGVCNQYGDNYVSVDPTDCLTPGTCLDAVMRFHRLDTTASRAVSVTFELSNELRLCTPDLDLNIAVITGAGSWLGTYTNYSVQTIDNGGGSYTVDIAILGVDCGPTNGGALFTVNLDSDETVNTVGAVTVTDVLVRDCVNAPLPGIPGPPTDISISVTGPDPLVGLTATQNKTGNDSDGTTIIDLAWTAPADAAASITIWRKGFGDYPEYDDGTGAVPVAPISVAGGWTEVATVPATTTTYADESTDRDFWYYAAYVIDVCDKASDAEPTMTGGTLNYHLGDVSDGFVLGQGDNLVGTADISLLGNNYGITLAHNDPVNYLDVGPTTDYSVDTLPTTDNVVQFEDLLMFAINYGAVSKSQGSPQPVSRDEIALQVGDMGEIGSTFSVELNMAGSGLIQGLSVPLRWNAEVVQPVSMSPGDLLKRQGGVSLVLAPEVGTVDAALFGVRERGISGEGLLATIIFRVMAAGDPGIMLGELYARDAENHEVSINGMMTSTPAMIPSATVLHNAVPNPFNPVTRLSFDLARGGQVTLQIYGLRGELVRTLVNAELPAGRHSMQWDGTDAAGRTVASGAYLVRLVAPDRAQSQRITLLK